jgi:beta-lactamase regulating signal transducer with metallopeptidase domain
MMFSAFMFSLFWTGALVNHLWQSTVVTLIAWLLTLALKNNQARTRYLIWMIASVKFLLPFSLLITAGEWLRSALATPVQRPALAAVMEQFTQPFPQTAFHTPGAVDYFSVASTAPDHRDWLPVILVATWLCGFLAIAISWASSWWQIRAAIHTGSPMTLLAGVPVLSSPGSLEPGVFGIIHPVLLLPEDLSDRLSPAQLNTIVAHEICHVRRRDNLTAAIHMVVAAAFWFHPAVWWIKARLLDERERACDEAVLRLGNQAQLYAESILNVCKFYVEAPMACMSGVTGSDLKRRIVRIMSEQAARKLDWGRKLLLCAAGMATVAAPVVFGLVHITGVRAQATAQNAAQGIADTWQGTFHVDRDLRVVFKI